MTVRGILSVILFFRPTSNGRSTWCRLRGWYMGSNVGMGAIVFWELLFVAVGTLGLLDFVMWTLSYLALEWVSACFANLRYYTYLQWVEAAEHVGLGSYVRSGCRYNFHCVLGIIINFRGCFHFLFVVMF